MPDAGASRKRRFCAP